MVGVECKCSAFDHVAKMSDPLEGSQEFSVVGRPETLVGLEL